MVSDPELFVVFSILHYFYFLLFHFFQFYISIKLFKCYSGVFICMNGVEERIDKHVALSKFDHLTHPDSVAACPVASCDIFWCQKWDSETF